MPPSSPLPDGVEQAFEVAAGELGMCSAAWLFLREVAAVGGDASVLTLRDRLGPTFPVLDALAAAWLEGARGPNTDPAALLAACRGAERLVIVGLEADFMDALIPRLAALNVEVALLRGSPFEIDWERVVANHAPHLSLVELDVFQRWAGPRSVLLTFAYGIHGHHAHVLPGWLRVIGADVRAQFRSFIAWDVLGVPMYVFPRWLVETPADGFTHLVRP